MIPVPPSQYEYERLKKVILDFIGENPGCTRDELGAHVVAYGGTVIDAKSGSRHGVEGGGYVGGDVAVGTLQIQLPIRALWWLKWVADREKVTPERLTEILVMRKLESMGEVNLSRSPRFDE